MTIRDQFGLDTMVLDYGSVSEADGIARRLLLLESVEDGAGTAGLQWADPGGWQTSDLGERPHSEQLDQRLREVAQQRDPPDGRNWTIPGWRARAEAWIADTLRAAGLGRASVIDQVRAREFSCVLRTRTEQEDLLFKALPTFVCPRAAVGSVPGRLLSRLRPRCGCHQ